MDANLNAIEGLSDQQRCRDMLVSLRKITQAITLHSRDLSRRYGLTSASTMLTLQA